MDGRVVGALMVVLLGLGAYYMVSQHNDRIVRTVEEIERGGPAWDAEAVAQAVGQTRRRLEQAHAALEARRLDEALAAHERARQALQYYIDLEPTREMEPGLTYGAWLQSETERFRAAMDGGLTWLFAELRGGDFPTDALKPIEDGLSAAGFDELRGRYDAELPRLAAERARQADGWLRIQFQGYTEDWAAMAMDALRDKWATERFKLVFGRPLSPQERDSTWKTIEVRIEEQALNYVADEATRRRIGQTAVPAIIESVRLTFKPPQGAPVPTTWDNLPPIQVVNDLPERLTLKLGADGGTLHEARATEGEYRTRIAESLADALRTVPAFAFYPGVDPDTLRVRNGENLDLEAARALGYLAPERLDAQLLDLAATDDPEVRARLIALMVELNLTQCASWVGEAIVTLDRRRLYPALAALKKRPWFGDYAPLIALIEADDHLDSSRVLEMLRGRIHNAELRRAVLGRIADPACDQRATYAIFLLQEADPGLRTACGERWIRDRDGDFACTVYNELANLDAALGERLLREHFDAVTPACQALMLARFRFDPQRHGEHELSLIRRAALQDEPRTRKAAAYEALLRAPDAPRVRQLLADLRAIETDPDFTRKLDERPAGSF